MLRIFEIPSATETVKQWASRLQFHQYIGQSIAQQTEMQTG